MIEIRRFNHIGPIAMNGASTVARLLIWAAIAAFCGGAASSQEVRSLDAIAASGVLRVGSTGDYRPYSYKDPATGRFSGIDIEMAGSLGRALGVRVEIVPTTWPSLADDLAAGRFDIAMGGISVTLARAKRFYYSRPTMKDGKTPIARCADAGRFETVAEIDRPEVRVIVNPGGTNEQFARAHFKSAALTVFPDNTRIFDQIAEGKADVMVTDASETRYQQKLRPGVLCAVHPDKPFDFSEKAYLMPRDEPMARFVDIWLQFEIESGHLAQMIGRAFD